ncbi:CDP-diacylglycerol--glycerol-3-phosphate 3-phosphatidyltransferase [Haloferula helveola]|uniref:CDP-diacylglycerol--glycerol-3-phosphate 3-phosphatidyltransferase n=1 Tax=Haloferula helveola TaxID=490095 RepID=A0ABM7RS31_9BACT|nr:CDP-diacylglycerol--glycerol-3-phosphate 3-phosphatidyltransferase [Haloferula helveola]
MTLASKITISRILLVPVFATLAIYYGISVEEGHPEEWLRWSALAVFIIASASDGLDGWIARRFNQRSHFGAVIDPIADKALLLTGIITLSAVDWGADGWSIPLWFAALVIVRDIIILGGLAIIHFVNHEMHHAPHWTGKVCTFAQMFTLGWVMLKVVPFSPMYPCIFAAVFTVWSGYIYLRAGIRQLQESPKSHPGSHP